MEAKKVLVVKIVVKMRPMARGYLVTQLERLHIIHICGHARDCLHSQ